MLRLGLISSAFALVICSSGASAAEKFVYPLPAASAVDVRKSVAYTKWKGADLVMDVYRPANRPSGARLPVVIFMNGFGGDSQREWLQYKSWASLAAANGFVAINPDTHSEGIEEDFDAIVAYLRAHAADLQADPDLISLWACSGHVFKSMPMAEDPSRTSIKSAVFYYGTGPVAKWRLDLPVQMVRAGLDRPGLNRGIEELSASALKSNAPFTVLNHPGGHHGFEAIDDDDTSREVIAQTLRFLKTTLTANYQAALHAGLPAAAAAGAVSTGDYETAARLYGPLAAANLSDSRLQLAYGEALLGARRFRDATNHFDKLRGNRELGPRDLGLPAARAAAQAGEAARAIEWLNMIPARFLPAEALRDPAFKSLESNPEFQAVAARPRN
ncbi:MAG: hypothetical protein ABI823_17830 [Bryobacteraceae bacterium]